MCSLQKNDLTHDLISVLESDQSDHPSFSEETKKTEVRKAESFPLSLH